MNFIVKLDDLMRWTRIGEQVSMATNPAMAKAMNAFGEGVVDGMVTAIEESLGLDPNAVRNAITVYRADPGELVWQADASALAMNESPNWEPQWLTNNDNTFEQEQLLNVIINDDETVCEVCKNFADDNPHTAAEINAAAAKWANWVPSYPVVGERTNLLHPNCRCGTQPWRSYRRLPVTMGKRGAETTKLYTPAQLGRVLASDLKEQIRMIIKDTR